MIAANVRLPKMALGDLNAALASVRIAENRCLELCGKYGKRAVAETFRHILESSERVSREAVTALPDGTYEAEDWIDGDGITEERFRTKVAVTIEGSDITVDYTGSCDQLQGPVNCSRPALVSAVKTVFKAIVDPQSPSNEGWFRPLKVAAPDGTVFTATKPAPVGWYYEGTGQASELAWKALAPIAPKRVSMGSANSLCVTVLGGHDRAKGEPWVMIEPSMVGWGATDERDGNCVTSAITNGDTFNYSIELLGGEVPGPRQPVRAQHAGRGRRRALPGRLRLDPRVRDHGRRRGALGELRPLDREALGARGRRRGLGQLLRAARRQRRPPRRAGRPPRS